MQTTALWFCPEEIFPSVLSKLLKGANDVKLPKHLAKRWATFAALTFSEKLLRCM